MKITKRVLAVILAALLVVATLSAVRQKITAKQETQARQ